MFGYVDLGIFRYLDFGNKQFVAASPFCVVQPCYFLKENAPGVLQPDIVFLEI